MRISVELVPRKKNSFLEEIKLVKENFSNVETINIPDIIRYGLRGWQAAGLQRWLK